MIAESSFFAKAINENKIYQGMVQAITDVFTIISWFDGKRMSVSTVIPSIPKLVIYI